jgi:hypothetical protein
MDEISSPIDDRLLDYLDGNLPAVERTALDTLLRQDAAVAARLEELRLMNALMSTQRLEAPSPNFTTSVMRCLDDRSAIARFSIRNGIFMVAGILVIVVFAAALVSTGTFDGTTTTIDLNEVTPPNRYFTNPYTLPSFSLNGRLIINGIIILNLTLAFIVLDRTVLRPFFQRRINAH